MREKLLRVEKYWGNDHPLFNGYRIDPQAIQPFSGGHPAIVRDWLANEAETVFVPDPEHQPTSRERRHRWLMKVENVLGRALDKKHYQLV